MASCRSAKRGAAVVIATRVLALAFALALGPSVVQAFYQLLTTGAGQASVSAQSAPVDATYITQTANGILSAEQALANLSDGLLKHAAGVVARAVPGTDYDTELTARVTADQATSSLSFADVTGLTWAVTANQVSVFECAGSYTSAVSTTALQLAINGPATPTAMRYTVVTATTATARHQASQSAADANTNPATGGAALALPVTIRGTHENGANAGTVAIRFRSEVSASAVTLLRGATCRVVVS